MNETHAALTQWFDPIALGRRLADEQVDEMASQFIHAESPLTREQFVREVRSWQRRIHAAADVGHSGEARRIGKEAVAILSEALGPLPPVDKYRGMTAQQIVDSIPR